jgi:hypothetical protein
VGDGSRKPGKKAARRGNLGQAQASFITRFSDVPAAKIPQQTVLPEIRSSDVQT